MMMLHSPDPKKLETLECLLCGTYLILFWKGLLAIFAAIAGINLYHF
jgi:hypothetical protein